MIRYTQLVREEVGEVDPPLTEEEMNRLAARVADVRSAAAAERIITEFLGQRNDSIC